MEYDELLDAIDEVNAKLDRYKQEYEQIFRDLTGQRTALKQALAATETGKCSADDAKIGAGLLRVEWHPAQRTPGPGEIGRALHRQFEAAREDIRHGARRMRREYFGIKEYDRWAAQETNCEYGMAPSHGNIWFRIGLANPRERIESAEDRMACIRYLHAVQADPDGVLG